MSTILDALRKAAERRPTEPATSTAVATARPVEAPPAAPLPERPEPVAAPPLPKAGDRIEPVTASGTGSAPPTSPPARSPVAIEQDLPATSAREAATSAPQWIDLPPPGDFPVPDEPSFLPTDDDGAARRKKVLRAVAVVTVGIMLGLLAGRRFLPESGTGTDDLLSDAALSKSAKKTAEPQALIPMEAAPTKPGAEPSPSTAVEEGSEEHSAASEKSRAGRGEKQRRDSEKTSAEKGADSGKKEKPSAETARSAADATPPFAAVPQPLQGRPKATTPPHPPARLPLPVAPAPPAAPKEVASAKPVGEAAAPKSGEAGGVVSGGKAAIEMPAASLPIPANGKPAPLAPPPKPPHGATGGLAALPPGTVLPLPLPHAAVTPPPPVPVSLPPLPDDAPAFALLFVQWSGEPTRRVASLRQSGGGTIYIVHEGDIVQGLRIAGIRPTGIEVEWRGQSFLLPASRH